MANKYPTLKNSAGLTWLKIKKPRKKEIEYLQNNYHFSMVHLNDCLPPLQRPRLIEHDDYLFMILTFPVYQAKSRKIVPLEVDFFISQNYLITCQETDFLPLDRLFEQYRKDKKLPSALGSSPGSLLYEILNDSIDNAFPMLNHISNDIETLEDKIFLTKKFKENVIHDILIARRNIVSFKKSIQAHKAVIRKMVDKSTKFFPTKRLETYFTNVVDDLKEIWDTLDNYGGTISAIFESNESIYSDRLNSIIKTLTIFSVIVFPLTLLAAIFGMNTTMPLVDTPYGFYKIVGLMASGTLIMLTIFKKKHWL
ncbi:MAG TPA: magnesium transporter CorA family protein [Candidatus Bipolaricaulota bacterium]|nr:magnesium transporter CorA family protein [Candidatus Bipolaricaulota bacterium]